MGEVQSGKTASYTGVICKAADLGYKVIIVVTTSNEKLRSQTQQRLDKEFDGYCNVSQMSTINIHGFLTGEEKRAESRTNILQDFGKAIKSATSFNPNAVSEPYFFVCKKLKGLLRIKNEQ